jgi:ABC-type Zn uptake system ZnuABC Zn-binding protein ZnuA
MTFPAGRCWPPCCSPDVRMPRTQATSGGATVVATTSTLASLAIGRRRRPEPVRSLVPVGASPEDYQPAPQDIEAIHDADVLVENGANLEGWLQSDAR